MAPKKSKCEPLNFANPREVESSLWRIKLQLPPITEKTLQKTENIYNKLFSDFSKAKL